MREILRFVFSIVLCQGVGILSGLATVRGTREWYPTLAKPSLTPPDAVFAPVWTALYLLMGVSLFLVWRQRPSEAGVRIALVVFFAQLILNGLWSILFFGLRNPLAAFVEILLLWAAIMVTLVLFARVSRAAALLLVPYALWVAFAAWLNYAIWRLNG